MADPGLHRRGGPIINPFTSPQTSATKAVSTQDHAKFGDKKPRSGRWCSISRCCTVIYVILFSVYLIGAGTRDARYKKKMLRRGHRNKQSLPPSAIHNDEKASYTDEETTSTIEDESRNENTEGLEVESTADDETTEDGNEEEDSIDEDETDNYEPSETTSNDDQTINEAVKETMDYFEEVREASMNENESILADTLQHIEETVWMGVKRIFGNYDDVSEQELQEIAQDVAKALRIEVQSDFKTVSDALTVEKGQEITEIVKNDKESELEAESIRSDVKLAEEESVKKLKKEINKAAQEATQNIEAKVAKIEKETIDKAMAKKKGKISHKVKIINNIVERDESADGDKELKETAKGEKENKKETKGTTSDDPTKGSTNTDSGLEKNLMPAKAAKKDDSGKSGLESKKKIPSKSYEGGKSTNKNKDAERSTKIASSEKDKKDSSTK